MKHKTEILVRHYECDAYGHVNNANYLNYLEHGRSEFLKKIGLNYKAFTDLGFGIYVVKVSINYRNPALPDDLLEIYTKPLSKKRATGSFFQEIKRGNTLICDAEIKWASVGADGKLMALPSEFDLEGLKPI